MNSSLCATCSYPFRISKFTTTFIEICKIHIASHPIRKKKVSEEIAFNFTASGLYIVHCTLKAEFSPVHIQK